MYDPKRDRDDSAFPSLSLFYIIVDFCPFLFSTAWENRLCHVLLLFVYETLEPTDHWHAHCPNDSRRWRVITRNLRSSYGDSSGIQANCMDLSKVSKCQESRSPVRFVLKASPPNVFIGGPVPNPPGFPLKACGNDGLRIGNLLNAASYGESTHRD